MFQIAVYGKGGIGKSTISANLSYALARNGKKVLQIGCDPKHDSTRLLLKGMIQTTVLNYIRDIPPPDRRLQDVLKEGILGIRCVEAGGPEPGIGCAGRGILSTFDALKKMGLDEHEFDIKLYDVLGDVVCGGFAVPLRREYADAIYLVTSGEFCHLCGKQHPEGSGTSMAAPPEWQGSSTTVVDWKGRRRSWRGSPAPWAYPSWHTYLVVNCSPWQRGRPAR
jgi:nitrogenase subunit NifH